MSGLVCCSRYRRCSNLEATGDSGPTRRHGNAAAATATLAVVGRSCEGAFRKQSEKMLLLLLPTPHRGGRSRDLDRFQAGSGPVLDHFRTSSGPVLGFHCWSCSASD